MKKLNKIDKAKELRKQIDASIKAVRQMIRIDELTEGQLNDIIHLYEEYKVDKLYHVGDLFRYEDNLYEVVQGHTSLENWIPSDLPALYKNTMHDDVIPLWTQPLGAHDAYLLDDLVIYDDKIWISLVDANTWKPTEYGWELYNE